MVIHEKIEHCQDIQFNKFLILKHLQITLTHLPVCIAYLPDNNPDNMVAISGVLVQLFTLAKYLKITPSDDIAYNTRGRGNIAPSKLVHNAKIAPTVMIHLISIHPSCSNT